MYLSPEIEKVPHWEWVWWDREEDEPVSGGPTGACIDAHSLMFEGRPRYQQRRIQNIYGKAVHKNCGGDLEMARNQEGCGSFQARLQCQSCGKLIIGEI